MTRIDVSAQTDAAAPSLREPQRFLPASARPAGYDKWTVDLPVGPFHHEAVLTVGPLWRDGPQCGRSIAWKPAMRDHDVLPYESLMPRVHGVLVLEGQHLTLHAHYTPSGGWVGRLVDLVLRPVARWSIASFLRELARTIDATVTMAPGGER